MCGMQYAEGSKIKDECVPVTWCVGGEQIAFMAEEWFQDRVGAMAR